MKRLALILLIPIVFLIYFYFQFIGPGETKEKERFIIKPNTLQLEIIDSLVAKHFLKNKTIFNWFLSRRGKDISPGTYLLSQNMNAYRLAVTLTSLPYQKWVTIPIGKRKEQVALILQRALDWPKKLVVDFIQTAQEGWLYADTYLINTDYDAQQTYQKLFNTFNENLDSDLQKSLLEQNIRLDTAIKFASLIEREYGSEEDRKIIAAIIWNRLDKDMRLQIDAAVQFAIASENCRLTNISVEDWAPISTCNFWPRLTGTGIRATRSPYNTYFNKGLPPGPICSPSIASIRAVANPVETDALYYLHSRDKQIHTANTYEEHLENVEEFLN